MGVTPVAETSVKPPVSSNSPRLAPKPKKRRLSRGRLPWRKLLMVAVCFLLWGGCYLFIWAVSHLVFKDGSWNAAKVLGALFTSMAEKPSGSGYLCLAILVCSILGQTLITYLVLPGIKATLSVGADLLELLEKVRTTPLEVRVFLEKRIAGAIADNHKLLTDILQGKGFFRSEEDILQMAVVIVEHTKSSRFCQTTLDDITQRCSEELYKTHEHRFARFIAENGKMLKRFLVIEDFDAVFDPKASHFADLKWFVQLYRSVGVAELYYLNKSQLKTLARGRRLGQSAKGNTRYDVLLFDGSIVSGLETDSGLGVVRGPSGQYEAFIDARPEIIEEYGKWLVDLEQCCLSSQQKSGLVFEKLEELGWLSEFLR